MDRTHEKMVGMDTLIFLHGPGQSPPAWQDVVGAISPEQPMVAPWLKGLKPTDHGGFHVDQAVEAVVDTMEVRGAERANLVGYSLGGLVALRLAVVYPQKVGRLILISTPVVPSHHQLSRQRMAVKMTPSVLFRGVGKEHVLAALDAMLEADLGVDLARVTAPTLAVAAADDPVGRASADLLASEVKAQIKLLPGADPNLLQSAAADLAQLIMDFCNPAG